MPERASTIPLIDDRFLLLENLGRGGMGRVVRAFDRLEGRPVALKVPLEPARSGPSHPLSAEYEVWTRLRHPHIVRAYELGRSRRGPLRPGTPYLVLEDFPGRPAHESLPVGRLDVGRLEEFARRVLHALVHVHGAGLVHRDLKPGNVLVAPARRGPGRVKLTDFGLAIEAGRRKKPGRISGSLLYVAPESVLGCPLDGRADLYGLGILLFLLATGRPPVNSRDPCEVLRWHLDGAAPDPSALRPELTGRFSRFVLRLAARDPDKRPASARHALTLLGGSQAASQRRRPHAADRGRLAALRLALDASRLGARRLFELPREADAARALVREAAVLSQIHGLVYGRLRHEPQRRGSDLDRLVLRLLLRRGPAVREVVQKHGLTEGLPLELLGGLPVWNRVRAGRGAARSDPGTPEATARGVAAFLLESAKRETLVVVADAGTLGDPLVRAVVDRLRRACDGRTVAGSAGSGLLLVLPARWCEAAGRLASRPGVPRAHHGAVPVRWTATATERAG